MRTIDPQGLNPLGVHQDKLEEHAESERKGGIIFLVLVAVILIGGAFGATYMLHEYGGSYHSQESR